GVLGTGLGTLIRNVHQQEGVSFYLGRKITAVEGKTVVLDEGTRLTADLVVGGIGVRPNMQLAESAGLILDSVLAVSEFTATSAGGVFGADAEIVRGEPRATATINRDRKNLETEVTLETELLLKAPPPVTIEATET